MLTHEKAMLRLVFGASVLFAAPAAFAQDAPVERPSVGRPALPQSSPEQPAPVERPATARPAPAQRAAAKERRARGDTPTYAVTDGHAAFFYLGAGLGLLSGLGGGKAFERSNPALTGIVGVEVPLGGATGLGFELAADAEVAGNGDRGAYTAALLRVRLAQLLTPSTRLWGAVGLGGAGYQTTSLAAGIAGGATFLFTPKFGLDLSANLNRVGASSDERFDNLGVTYDYDGGFVLLIAVKALFELHKTR